MQQENAFSGYEEKCRQRAFRKECLRTLPPGKLEIKARADEYERHVVLPLANEPDDTRMIFKIQAWDEKLKHLQEDPVALLDDIDIMEHANAMGPDPVREDGDDTVGARFTLWNLADAKTTATANEITQRELAAAAAGLDVSQIKTKNKVNAQKVILTDNSLSFHGPYDMHGMYVLARMLRNDEWVTTLRARRCLLDVMEVRMLSIGLGTNVGMRVLDLSSNPIQSEGLALLSSVLRTNTSLTSLTLSDCSLGGTIENLGRANEHFKPVKLRSPESGLAAFIAAVGVNTGLQFMDLRQNLVPEKAWEQLGRALQENRKCKVGSAHFDSFSLKRKILRLQFDDKRLTVPDAFLLAGLFSNNKFLRSIDLSANRLYPEGCARVAKALHLSPTVTELNIAGNHLCANHPHDNTWQKDLCGLKAINEMLQVNTTLTHLELSENHLSGIVHAEDDPDFSGVLALFRVLERENRTLTSLGLSDSELTGALHNPQLAVVEALVATMLHNPTICFWDLRKNGLGGWDDNEPIIRICNSLMVSESMVRIDLSDNRVNNSDGQMLSQAMHSAHVLGGPLQMKLKHNPFIPNTLKSEMKSSFEDGVEF
jgi:Ran GTPase-activating protein (RanGAP) involved in mRNA processing and transport